MKRLLDIIVSLVLLFILAPLLFVIALIVKINLGGPVLFCQKRPGRMGMPFNMFKFRTMSNETDNLGGLLPDTQRITRFGQWLRSSSLDELPELWNVLKGEMSLVGPRPLLMEYLSLYNAHQMRRHEVRPGITGWAQINGRNNLTWNDKFDLDIWYVDNHSVLLDFKVCFLTIKKVILKEGISFKDHVTTEKFMGNNK
jgi:sugar transferase EpsL